MRLPTFTLEKTKLPRIIFSVLPSPQGNLQNISPLMKKAYEMGVSHFDLPSQNHLESFRELRTLTEDEGLLGFCHIGAEQGVSFLGRPLHCFEAKVVSTLKKNIFPLELIQGLKTMGVWNSRLFFPAVSSPEVFTQKELDRLALDSSRFDKALSLFRPEESPFLFLGGKYGDWIMGLGRVDLLKDMARKVREKGFIPIFSARWTTFILPKAKSIDVAAYAIPINRNWSLFDLTQACVLVKKFDKPLISLNPFADGKLLTDSEEALAFLFKELKVHGAVAEMGSEEEGRNVLKALEKFPSVIPPRKT
jgi:hypothetical protein